MWIFPSVVLWRNTLTRLCRVSFLSLSDFLNRIHRPGCEICVMSMMPCSRPSLKVSGRLYRDTMFHEIYLPAEQVGVPADMWEWLKSREDRRSAWKAREDAWMKGGLRRYEMCTEMELAQRPFSVTCHSISGRLFRYMPSSRNADFDDRPAPAAWALNTT